MSGVTLMLSDGLSIPLTSHEIQLILPLDLSTCFNLYQNKKSTWKQNRRKFIEVLSSEKLVHPKMIS